MGGGGGGAVSKKNFFVGPWASVWFKNERGVAGPPPGPSPGPATVEGLCAKIPPQ